jgi:predicted nucleotide-binding protein
MEKFKYYDATFFPASVIEEAHNLFLNKSEADKEQVGFPSEMSVGYGHETWKFDDRDEFLMEYQKAQNFYFDHILSDGRLVVQGDRIYRTRVDVAFKSRGKIEAIFQIFEREAENARIVKPERGTTVFIGHGHDPQWRDLKDHLHDIHGLEVIAYEVGPRAGLSVKEVLQEMLSHSSIAFLVLTGEDIHQDGELHARENVIHEVGLFQGRLGFERALVLLEEGVKEFSNIFGINQIRFPKGRIRESFGDVLGTIRREFERT